MINKLISHLYHHLKRTKLFYFFLILSNTIFSVWLFTFWPAILTRDSINSWDQITTNTYSNWHPYIFTFYLKALSLVSFTPASVAIFQIFLSSILSSYIFFRLYKIKNKLFTIIAFFLFVSSIPIGLYNITIWKDIIFSQLVILWGISIYFFIKDKRGNLSYTTIFLFSILLFFTASVRYNGVIFLIFIPGVFYFGKILNLKKTIVFFILSLSLYASLQLILPTLFSITDNKRLLNLSYKIQLDAAILQKNGFVYTARQTGFPLSDLNKLIPLDTMKNNYLCQNTNAILFSQDIHPNLLKNDQYYSEVNSISNQLILSNISRALNDRICLFKSILLSEGTLYYNTLDKENIAENDSLAHLEQRSRAPSLYPVLKSIIYTTKQFPLNLLFWNMFLPFFAFIFSLFWGYFKDKALFAYSSIVTIQLPFIFLTITANEFRYIYFLYLGSFFLIPMLTKDTSAELK